jgi:hypothetical protein
VEELERVSFVIVQLPGSEATHLAQTFGDKAFAVCGNEAPAEPIDEEILTCRRCRSGASSERQELLKRLAAARAEASRIEATVGLLSRALGSPGRIVQARSESNLGEG